MCFVSAMFLCSMIANNIIFLVFDMIKIREEPNGKGKKEKRKKGKKERNMIRKKIL